MDIESVTEIIKQFFEMGLTKLNMGEQLLYMGATYRFAEEVKPLVTKYAVKEPVKSTFLMKLGDE